MSHLPLGLPSAPRGRAPASLALAFVATVATLVPTVAHAETLSERLDHQLSELAKARGLMSHWYLAEVQRLAPSVAGGVARALPRARALAGPGSRASPASREPWMQGEALGTVAGLIHPDHPAEARKAVLEAGVLATGAVLGPLRGSGAEGGDPAPTFDPAARVEGLRERVGWRPFRDAALTGPVQVDDLLDCTGDCHGVLLTAIEARRSVDAMIVLGSNGPITAWLDGRLVASFDGERRFTDWQHAIPVRLGKGVHHLAIRVGHRSEAPNLLARLIDRRGRLPAELKLRGPHKGDVLATWTASRRLPRALGQLSAGADVYVRGLARLLTDPEPLEKRAAARFLEAAVAEVPDDPERHFALARAERSDANRARAALERADEAAGGQHAAALGALLERNHEMLPWSPTTRALAARLRALDPAHPRLLEYTVESEVTLLDAPTALARAAALATHPDPHLQRLYAASLERAGKPWASAIAWNRFARTAAGAPSATQLAVLGAIRSGRIEEAVAWSKAALERRPYSVDLRLLHARSLAASPGGASPGGASPGGAARAIAYLEAVAADHPTSAGIPEMLGRLSLLQRDRRGAIQAFDRALELRPQDRDLADYRRTLLAERRARAGSAEDVAKLIAGAPAPGDVGARYLLDKRVVSVSDQGLASHFRQMVIRLEGDQATKQFEAIPLPWTPGEDRIEIIEAEIIRGDGTRIRPIGITDQRPRGKQGGVYTLGAARVVRFANLKDADVVHIQFRRDEIGERNMFGRFFGLVAPLSDIWPKERVELTIDAPAARTLHHHAERIPPAVRTVAEGRQRLTWRTTKPLPAITPEPLMPGYGAIGAYVNVSTYESWQQLALWYRDLVAPQLTLGPELEALVDRLVGQLAEGKRTPRDKVVAVQDWVVKNTRYVGIEFGIHGFKPYRVTQVVQRGYGDCKDKASLLVAMLRHAGVAAEFVLVRTRDLGPLSSQPATLWAFNHAIAYVPAIDTYIDATSERAGVGEVPTLDQGAMILRVDLYDRDAPVTLGVLPMSAASHNRSTSEVALTLAADGSARGHVVETTVGTRAPKLRGLLADAAQRDTVVARLLGGRHTSATLDSARYVGLDQLGMPVTLDLRVTLPRLARRAGDQLTIPLHAKPSELLDRYAGLSQRHHPLLLDVPFEDETTERVVLPAGATVAALPGPTRLETPFGSYQRTVVRTKVGYVATEKLVLTSTRVEPAAYEAFRAFLVAITKARSEVVRAALRP